MTYSDLEIMQIKQAYRKYFRQIGKHSKADARILLEQLKLSDRPTEAIRKVIDEWAEKDTFAGYARFDGLAIRIQMFLLRETGEKVQL